MGRFSRTILASVLILSGGTLLSSHEFVRAEEVNKPAVPPLPRTINLNQEQRFVIKENVKDLGLPKARKDAPEIIGDPMPQNIELHALPAQVATKVPQARSHSFYIKEGDNAVVLVSPNDRRVADVILLASSRMAAQSALSSAFASFRSRVSNPLVNQP